MNYDYEEAISFTLCADYVKNLEPYQRPSGMVKCPISSIVLRLMSIIAF